MSVESINIDWFPTVLDHYYSSFHIGDKNSGYHMVDWLATVLMHADRSIHFSFLRSVAVSLFQGLSFINNGQAKVSGGRERDRQTVPLICEEGSG